eukprot:1956994-Ditylum_brightwellii.AAC.1
MAMPSLWQWQLFLAANGTTCKGNNNDGLVVLFLAECILRSKASHLNRTRRAISLIVKQQKHALAFGLKERQKERKSKCKRHQKTVMLMLLT